MKAIGSILVTLLAWPTICLPQCNLNCLKTLWQQHQYERVIELGIPLRDNLEFKGIPALDYMIASSICMLHPDQPEGCALFRELTTDYYSGVSGADIHLLQQEFTSICGEHHTPNPAALERFRYVQFAGENHSAIFSGQGKSFMLIHEGLRMILSDPGKAMSSVRYFNFNDRVQTNRLTESRVQFYLSRRVALGDIKGARRLALQFGEKARFFVSDHFICIGGPSQGNSLRTTAGELEKAFAFFCSYFGFTPTHDYITVYLVGNLERLDAEIKRVYQESPNSFLIGYSNFFDNSMMAWLPSPDQVGTCKHELIHLLVRTKFSNLPHWLEEGLATLYEESRYNGDSSQLVGVNNWRLPLVKENYFHLSLKDILVPDSLRDLSLDSTAKEESDRFYKKMEKTAKDVGNYDGFAMTFRDEKETLKLYDIPNFFNTYLLANKDALDRYFILYLQQNGKLRALFHAFMDREKNIFAPNSYIPTTELILSTLGMADMDDVQTDFERWLANQ